MIMRAFARPTLIAAGNFARSRRYVLISFRPAEPVSVVALSPFGAAKSSEELWIFY
jgi:hypothetical protein